MSNDPFYRAGQRIGRKIDDGRLPEPQVGRVSDDADTVQKTAEVKVGKKTVSAYYVGPTPKIGDRVIVQEVRGGHLMTVQPQRPTTTVTGAALALPPISGPNTNKITECWLWGHSYLGWLGALGAISTYGFDAEMGHPFTLDDFFFQALGIKWPAARAFGHSGAQLYSFVHEVMDNFVPVYNQGKAPYLARHGCHGIILGTNDLTIQQNPAAEGGRPIIQWKHGVQFMSAWLRLGGFFSPELVYNAGAPEGGTPTSSKYAGTTYGAGWNRIPPAGQAPTIGNGGLDLFSHRFYPGDAFMATTTPNAPLTIRVPADHPGSTVWVFFVGEIGNTGATAATCGGVAFSTNDIVRAPQIDGVSVPSYTMVAVPVPLAYTGAVQTIAVNAGPMPGGHRLAYCGWGIESPDPKLIAWGSIPIVKSWAGTRAGAQPQDAWVPQYDAATREVAARFLPAGSVCVADMSPLNGITHPEYFRDGIHPTPEGSRILAHALIDGMNVTALPTANLASAGQGAEFLEAFMAVPT